MYEKMFEVLGKIEPRTETIETILTDFEIISQETRNKPTTV